MWKRDLLFVTVIAGAILAMGGVLSRELPETEASIPANILPDDSLSRSVSTLNASFEKLWDEQGVTPTDQAPDLTIARRLSLALMGTIPSLEEIRLFESAPASSRIGWWVDRLLKDRRWSDYMAERLARAYVGSGEGPFVIYRRRRFVLWLAEQLHSGRPYDELVRNLIQSRGIWTDQPETNFITIAINPDNQELSETQLAGTISRVFLGIRIDCAECHDHPFDDWTQEEFHGLAAFFGQTKSFFTGIGEDDDLYHLAGNTPEEDRVIAPAVPFQQGLLPEEGPLRDRLGSWITHPDNRAFPRATVNRVWALMFGRPLIDPVDNIDPDSPLIGSLDLLAKEFVSTGYDLRRLICTIALSRVFQIDSKATGEDNLSESRQQYWAAFPLIRLRPEQLVGSILQATSLSTIDYHSHIIVRLARAIGQNDFIDRYGDAGADELEPQGATIPQHLLMMNGELVAEKTEYNLLGAPGRISRLAPDNASAIEISFLSTLSRRPSKLEQEHFLKQLSEEKSGGTASCQENMYWALINSTEFSWNH